MCIRDRAYTDDVISTWTHNVNKIITFGYWYASWYGEARYLASINAANKTFTSQRPAFYGVSNGRPFCMMNVYEAVSYTHLTPSQYREKFADHFYMEVFR